MHTVLTVAPFVLLAGLALLLGGLWRVAAGDARTLAHSLGEALGDLAKCHAAAAGLREELCRSTQETQEVRRTALMPRLRAKPGAGVCQPPTRPHIRPVQRPAAQRVVDDITAIIDAVREGS